MGGTSKLAGQPDRTSRAVPACYFIPMRRKIHNGSVKGIMNAAIDNLTPAEAAVVAGVSMRDVQTE